MCVVDRGLQCHFQPWPESYVLRVCELKPHTQREALLPICFTLEGPHPNCIVASHSHRSPPPPPAPLHFHTESLWLSYTHTKSFPFGKYLCPCSTVMQPLTAVLRVDLSNRSFHKHCTAVKLVFGYHCSGFFHDFTLTPSRRAHAVIAYLATLY